MPWFIFFFNDTATTEIYTLSLHDALPISIMGAVPVAWGVGAGSAARKPLGYAIVGGGFFSAAPALFVAAGPHLLVDRFTGGKARRVGGEQTRGGGWRRGAGEVGRKTHPTSTYR